jgi:hypothetical protein
MHMEDVKRVPKAAWWIGGAILAGAAFAGLHRLLKFDIDFDPWDDAYLY